MAEKRIKMCMCALFVSLLPIIRTADVCCFPKQLEGDIEQTSSASGSLITQRFQVSYDAIGQRLRRVYTSSSGEKSVILDFLYQDHRIEYVIFNSTCKTYKLGPLIRSWVCVPGDAKLIRKYNFGLKPSIPVSEYMFQTDNGSLQYIRTVTPECVPLEDKIQESDSEVSIYTYEDLTTGIKDPSVFDIPAICNKTAYAKTDEYMDEGLIQLGGNVLLRWH